MFTDSYIVRLHAKETGQDVEQGFRGTVLRVGSNGWVAFSNLEDLWAILTQDCQLKVTDGDGLETES